MAERLPLRGGAVAAALAVAHEDAAPVAVGPARPAVTPSAEPLVDISEMVGVSGPNSRGLPWIEYRGRPTT